MMLNSTVEIRVICGKCDNKFNVYQLDWTHIQCKDCQNIIENNLYSDDEPMLHQYVEE